MMVFPADMKPTALVQNKGKPFTFTCDICGESANGVRVQPDDDDREDWAVLPEEWAEIEDRREYAPKQFMTVCPNGDCRHEATSRS